MHSKSTSGAFDDLGDIHTAKRDINQHIAAALLALQCVGLRPVMVHPVWCRGRLDMSSPLSIPFSTLWQWSMWEILMFLWRHQAKLDGQMHMLTNTFRGQYMFTKSFALTYLHSSFSFFPDRLQMIQSLVLFLSPVLLLLAHLFPLFFVSILSFLVPGLSREQYCAGQRGWGWKAGWGGCRCSVTTALWHHTHKYIAPY